MKTADASIYNLLVDEMDKLSTRLHGAVVFVDDGFTDILHWLGGAQMLLQYGTVAIKHFSSFEGGEEGEEKAAIFMSTAFQQDEEATVKDIICNSHFSSITIFTNVHPAIQALVNFRAVNDEEVREIIEGVERKITLWMNDSTKTQCEGEFMYTPLSFCPILSPTLFITPTHSSFFPLTPYQISLLSMPTQMPASTSEPPKLHFEHLPKEMQLQYKLLVSSLNSFCDVMRIDEEIFSVGVSSAILAGELASLTWRGSRKPSNSKACLLLIDRTLDLSTPSHHSFECILDRIFSTLPPSAHHDVMVDVSAIYQPTNQHSTTHTSGDQSIHGNLAQSCDQKSTSLLNSFIFLKQKEISMQVNRSLMSILRKEALADVKQTNKAPGIDALMANIALLKNRTEVIRRNCAFVQLSLAFVQACRGHKRLRQLQTIENIILQNIDDDGGCGGVGGSGGGSGGGGSGGGSGDLVLRVVDEFCKMREDDDALSYPLDDLFILLLHLFSITHVTMTSQQQDILENRLTQQIMTATRTKAHHTLIQWDDMCGGGEGDCRLVLQEALCQLKWLSRARLPLSRYKSVLTKGSFTSPTSHRPIMKQILDDVTDPTNQLADIKRRSTRLGVIKSGFGFLMAAAKMESHPLDHPVLVVFVVGGVSLGEVKMVLDHFANKKYQGKVIVGSTSVLTPHKVMQLALFNPHSCLL